MRGLSLPEWKELDFTVLSEVDVSRSDVGERVKLVLLEVGGGANDGVEDGP